MTIKEETKDIFLSDSEMIVNPVNVVGVSGKGLAKAFAEHFPEATKLYEEECSKGSMVIGRVFVVKDQKDVITGKTFKYICYFPTKGHWKNKSQYSYIVMGLLDLIKYIGEHQVKSVSLPLLGAGLGGLDYEKITKIMFEMLNPVPDCSMTLNII